MERGKALSSRDFINHIRDSVYSGHGFVPFIGSGMSAPSGILMGMEFSNFLAYSVYEVVKKKWNLRKGGWPRYPRDEEVRKVKVWTYRKFDKICKNRGYRLIHETDADGTRLVREVRFAEGAESPTAFVQAVNRPLIPLIIRSSEQETWLSEERTKILQNQFRRADGWANFYDGDASSRTSKAYTLERAIRSMHDWRATLQFLALTKFDTSPNHVVLDETADDSVIDAFNVHITRDRQINLGHKMIAHLVRPLRIRTILTTNFDRLLEVAFHKLLIPLHVIPVSLEGKLPDPVSVRAQNTLVKLHGDSTETRADFSLDEEPSKLEKERFARFVRGDFDNKAATSPIPNHLLVMGFSGSDMRIVQMMKYLLDTRLNVTIYWICHAANEVDRIAKKFGDEYSDRLVYHQTDREDLFLYELYQELTLCLPSGGFSYEFTQKVPPETFTDRRAKNEANFQKAMKGKLIEKFPATNRHIPEKVLDHRWPIREGINHAIGKQVANVITGSEPVGQFMFPSDSKAIARIVWKQKIKSGGDLAGMYVRLFVSSGGAGAMRVAYNELVNSWYHCLWLELSDYSNASSLAEEVARIIALRVGFFQLEHTTLCPNEFDKNSLTEHFEHLLGLLGVSDRKWTLFFYGRDVAGSTAGWNDTPWPKQEYKKLAKLLKSLTDCGVHIVYVPLTKSRIKRDKKKLKAASKYEPRIRKFTNLSKSKTISNENAMNAWEESKSSQRHSKRIKIKWDKGADRDSSLSPPGFFSAALVPNKYRIFDNLLDKVVSNWLDPKLLKSWGGKPGKPTDARRLQLYANRLKFLYSITLFRQSRHTSAFFSDAVYSCPKRFNLSGIDNDWFRASDVSDWISELGDVDVFFYKPGGYSWKYRDIRLGLRVFLESIPYFRYKQSTVDSFNQNGLTGYLLDDRIDFALQSRARQHYWIGEWYVKAFAATGHFMPVVESLYHRLKCIEYTQFAKPGRMKYAEISKRKNYHSVLARSAIMEMIKTIRIARPWMKFWLSGNRGHSMFSDSGIQEVESVCSIASAALPKKWQDEFNELTKILSNELCAMQSSLRGEAAETSKRWHPPSIPHAVDNGFKSKWDTAADGFPNISLEKKSVARNSGFDREFRTWFNDKDKLDAKFVCELMDAYRNGDSDDVNKDLIPKMTNWIVANLRGFDSATGLLQVGKVKRRKLRSISLQGKPRPRSRKIGKPSRRIIRRQDNIALLRLVDLVADYAYLHVKRAKLEFHAHGKWTLASRKRFGQTTILCFLGLSLCRHLHPHFFEKELRLKVKIHTLYGLALAYLDRPFEANRHINEAKALLSKSSHSLDEIELAVVRLRQAEIYLVQAERVSNILDGFINISKGLSSAKRIINAVEEYLNEDQEVKYRLRERRSSKATEVLANPLVRRLVENSDSDPHMFQEKNQESLHRLLYATLDDAWVLLESAERLLAGRSQSSLWWGRLFALKLRAYSMVRKDARFETLVFRQKVQHDEEVRKLRDRLLLNHQSCKYMQLRTAELVADAMAALSLQKPNAVFSRKDNSCIRIWGQGKKKNKFKQEIKEFDSILISKYFKRVKKHIEQTLDALPD